MKGCILKAHLEGQEWQTTLFTSGLDIFEKRKHQKKGGLKQRTQASLYILYWGFKKTPCKACLLLCNTKNSKNYIFFHSLIIEFLWFAWLRLKFEEKIHTDAIVNASREEDSPYQG